MPVLPKKSYAIAFSAIALAAGIGISSFNVSEAPKASVSPVIASTEAPSAKPTPAPAQPYTGPDELVLPTGKATVENNGDGSKTVKYVSFDGTAKPWTIEVPANKKLSVEPISGAKSASGKAITYIAVSQSEISEMTQTNLSLINSETGEATEEFISNYETSDVQNPAYGTPRVKGSGILTVVDGKQTVVPVPNM